MLNWMNPYSYSDTLIEQNIASVNGEVEGYASLSKPSLRIVDYLMHKGYPFPEVISDSSLASEYEKVLSLEMY